MKEEWLMPGAVVPVDVETTAALVAEIKRLIGVVGDMALNMQPAQQQKEGFASPGGGYVPAIPRPMPLDWKLVPRKATPEMLKAMDECAQEGYDERLYAGMASSVYMAAWDASPVMGTLPEQPAQQEPVAWITQGGKGWLRWHNKNDDHLNKTSVPLYKHPKRKPLSDAEIALISAECSLRTPSDIYFARAIEAAHGIKE